MRGVAAGRGALAGALRSGTQRGADFTTLPGCGEVRCGYGPTSDNDYPGFERDWLARGVPVHPGLYSERAIAGGMDDPAVLRSGTPADQRAVQDVLAAGRWLACGRFDMPTVMGRDSDDPAAGAVGTAGWPSDSAADMDVLFNGIDLAAPTQADHLRGRAVTVFCHVLVGAETAGRRSVPTGRYAADRHLPRSTSRRRVALSRPDATAADRRTDGLTAASGSRATSPLSVSGYQIREAGSTAGREAA